MKTISMADVERAFDLLAASIPSPETELESVNEYTLLVAVVLSAQMTDKGVNRATKALFAVADSPERMLALGEEGLRERIKSVNLYPTKARHIIALSERLVSDFGGKVPGTREELESLPGVGRKTASVILNVVFGQPTIPVDTHLLRLAPRLGLSFAATPRAIEEELLSKVPARHRMVAHHLLLLHGRYVCKARSPLCGECCLAALCPRNGLAPPDDE
jgi:endonuclease-3